MSSTSPELAAPNPVKAGDKFPDGVEFTWVLSLCREASRGVHYVPYTPEKESITSCGMPQKFEASKEFANKKEHLSEIKSKGVDLVIVIAFNDAWVMSAWAKANGIKDEILFATDSDTQFSKRIGWTRGDRTGRYAMVIDHGKITYAEVESGGDVTVSARVNTSFALDPSHKTSHKPLDVITLFHKASSPASMRAQTLLKQVSAQASETSTEDQATDHSAQNKLQRTDFELNVTEDPPTSDQLRNILEYVGSGSRKAGQIVDGAVDEADALKKLKEDPDKFRRPVVCVPRIPEPRPRKQERLTSHQIVDWNNGRAVAGDNESEIMNMIRQLPKETDSV
ncbi:MAG: hypothetical protein Q9208_003722 [Pyrenodesmia sp. 3 TL-2023]